MQTAGFLLLGGSGEVSTSFPTLPSKSTLLGDGLLSSSLSGDGKVLKKGEKRFSEQASSTRLSMGRMLSFLSGELSAAQKRKGWSGLMKALFVA